MERRKKEFVTLMVFLFNVPKESHKGNQKEECQGLRSIRIKGCREESEVVVTLQFQFLKPIKVAASQSQKVEAS